MHELKTYSQREMLHWLKEMEDKVENPVEYLRGLMLLFRREFSILRLEEVQEVLLRYEEKHLLDDLRRQLVCAMVHTCWAGSKNNPLPEGAWVPKEAYWRISTGESMNARAFSSAFGSLKLNGDAAVIADTVGTFGILFDAPLKGGAVNEEV